jgi:3-oxoacyl-[acyl-carrier protein] reductase
MREEKTVGREVGMKLAGRVALVTAGSKGIGRATALRLAQDGADVAISYARDEAAAADCVAAVLRLGRRAFALRAPAEDLEAGERLVARARETLGPIGILVNSAGVDWDGTPVAETKPEDLLRVMTINALLHE